MKSARQTVQGVCVWLCACVCVWPAYFNIRDSLMWPWVICPDDKRFFIWVAIQWRCCVNPAGIPVPVRSRLLHPQLAIISMLALPAPQRQCSQNKQTLKQSPVKIQSNLDHLICKALCCCFFGKLNPAYFTSTLGGVQSSSFMLL